MGTKGGAGQRGDPVGTGDVHLSPVEGTHWDGLIAEELRDSGDSWRQRGGGGGREPQVGHTGGFILLEEGQVDASTDKNHEFSQPCSVLTGCHSFTSRALLACDPKTRGVDTLGVWILFGLRSHPERQKVGEGIWLQREKSFAVWMLVFQDVFLSQVLLSTPNSGS